MLYWLLFCGFNMNQDKMELIEKYFEENNLQAVLCIIDAEINSPSEDADVYFYMAKAIKC